MTSLYTRKTDNVDDVMAADVNELQAGLAFGHIPGGRLTLQTGTAISPADQSAKATLYYTAYHSNRIGLYSGTYWEEITFSSDLSLSLAALTASTPYDIFCYNNLGTATLEATAWASATARATALTTQDGRYVRSGATTRLYLGTVYINSTGGQSDDAVSKRFVWNYYNRLPRLILTYNSTANWTYATNTTREYNGGTGQVRGEFVVGLREEPYIGIYLSQVTSGTYGGILSFVPDSTTSTANALTQYTLVNGTITQTQYVPQSMPVIGYHYLTQTESVSSGTMTNNGANYRGAFVVMNM